MPTNAKSQDGSRHDGRAQGGAQYAYEQIRKMAVAYDFPPKESVNEVALAKQLGVSRTPIREALNRLAVEGLLVFVPRKGFTARGLDANEIVDLYELRLALEIAAFRLACARASDEEIAELRKFWADVGSNYGGMPAPEIAGNDETFHRKLIALAKNDQIVATIDQVAARIKFCRIIDLENRTRRGPLYDQHIDILDALEKRDAEAGVAALRDHIAMSRDQAVEVIKEGLARIYIKE